MINGLVMECTPYLAQAKQSLGNLLAVGRRLRCLLYHGSITSGHRRKLLTGQFHEDEFSRVWLIERCLLLSILLLLIKEDSEGGDRGKASLSLVDQAKWVEDLEG